MRVSALVAALTLFSGAALAEDVGPTEEPPATPPGVEGTAGDAEVDGTTPATGPQDAAAVTPMNVVWWITGLVAVLVVVGVLAWAMRPPAARTRRGRM